MKYFLLVSLFVFSILTCVPVFAQSTIPIPSPHCLGSCKTQPSVTGNTTNPISSAPSSISSGTPSSSQPNPSAAPSDAQSPTSTLPCSSSQPSLSSQNTGTVYSMHYHGKRHHSVNGGSIQQFFQLLWQLLQFLFQKLGIQLPSLTPCSSNTSPSAAPSAAAPSAGAGGGGGNISGTPSSAHGGNPTPTIFGQPNPNSQPPSSNSGFITASGTQLMLNGKPFRFIGFNPNGIIGQCWSGNNWTTAEMDTYFSNLPANGMARIFAVQNNPGGVSYIESIVNEATKYHQHLIIGLSDDNSNCSDLNGSGNGQQGSGKTLSYYQSSYQSGSNYANWVKQLVTPLADNPTVAIWEIGNEPFHSGNGEGGATVVGQGIPLSTAQAYINGADTLIKAAGAKQLISIAPADVSDMGGAADYQALFSKLDILDFHDYSWDWGGGQTISGDFAQVKQAAKNLNKPFISDEVGVSGGSGCTSNTPNPGTADTSANHSGFSLAARKTWLINKTNMELSTTGTNGGASGVVYWNYLNANEQGYRCGFNMSPSDPMISAVKNYKLPN